VAPIRLTPVAARLVAVAVPPAQQIAPLLPPLPPLALAADDAPPVPLIAVLAAFASPATPPEPKISRVTPSPPEPPDAVADDVALPVPVAMAELLAVAAPPAPP
jgi:hypothetical protein